MPNIDKICCNNTRKTVFVGLSGGVDSSVSAALLQKAGFNVRGVFIKVWQPNIILTGGCTWREDRLDAMRVCAKLGIPFYTLNLEKEYKKEVVDYMISEYKSGRTPNPDVMCNKFIKFGGFFDWAMKNGADYVATGHYARVNKRKDGIFELWAGKDDNKDQSYFLWTLTQTQLSKAMFPIGEFDKPIVRNMANKFKLETATKKDSQGLCFIGKIDMTDFLKNYIKAKNGNVLNVNGEVIGKHDGAMLYTIGQRHGFSITKNSPTSDRNYVISKDIIKNTITVSNKIKKKGDLVKNKLIISNTNWISGSQPSISKLYKARIRYRGTLSSCRVKTLKNSRYLLAFNDYLNYPTSGQSAVLYDGKICLGGGIIE